MARMKEYQASMMDEVLVMARREATAAFWAGVAGGAALASAVWIAILTAMF